MVTRESDSEDHMITSKSQMEIFDPKINTDATSSSTSSRDRYPVLLAEDNPDDVLIAKRAWKKGLLKNKLYIVNNGADAIKFLFKQDAYANAPTPCLMLLDLKMPKVDGFEVLNTVKQDPRLKKLPIIVLTTSNRDKDIQRAFDLGCNSYIVKPVSYENFLKAVLDIQRYWILLNEIPSTYESEISLF